MGGAAMCTAAVDDPEGLKHLLARITDIIIEVGLAHADLLPRYAAGQFNSYRLWTPGRTVTLTLDGASQRIQAWTGIPNLGLQCVIDQAWLPEGRNQPIGPQIPELLPDLERILAHASLMLNGYWNGEWLALVRDRLPASGCAITGLSEDPGALRRIVRP